MSLQETIPPIGSYLGDGAYARWYPSKRGAELHLYTSDGRIETNRIVLGVEEIDKLIADLRAWGVIS